MLLHLVVYKRTNKLQIKKKDKKNHDSIVFLIKQLFANKFNITLKKGYVGGVYNLFLMPPSGKKNKKKTFADLRCKSNEFDME